MKEEGTRMRRRERKRKAMKEEGWEEESQK